VPAAAVDPARWVKEAARRADRPLLPSIEPLASTDFTLTMTDGNSPPERTRVIRHRLLANIRTETVHAGALRGLFFPAKQPRFAPAVLIVGGSESGLVPTRAAALAAHGISTLAIGYFNYLDRPGAGRNLPLEYFADGLRWLRNRVGHRRVGIWGTSRGSEAALLTAAHFPELARLVVAWVPSNVVNPGLDLVGGKDFRRGRDAMWSLGGVPIRGVPLRAPSPTERVSERRAMRHPPGLTFADQYTRSWAAGGVQRRFAIPVERMRAPLLLVSGGADGLWPSSLGASRVTERLELHRYSYPVQHLCYPGAGHAIGVPNDIRPFSNTMCWSGGYGGVRRGLIHYGGTPSLNALATREAWQSAVEFMLQHLGR